MPHILHRLRSKGSKATHPSSRASNAPHRPTISTSVHRDVKPARSIGGTVRQQPGIPLQSNPHHHRNRSTDTISLDQAFSTTRSGAFFSLPPAPAPDSAPTSSSSSSFSSASNTPSGPSLAPGSSRPSSSRTGSGNNNSSSSNGAVADAIPSRPDRPPLDEPVIQVLLREYDARDFGNTAETMAAWFNERWRKSGYQVTAAEVATVLQTRGRLVRRRGPGEFDEDERMVR